MKGTSLILIIFFGAAFGFALFSALHRPTQEGNVDAYTIAFLHAAREVAQGRTIHASFEDPSGMMFSRGPTSVHLTDNQPHDSLFHLDPTHNILHVQVPGIQFSQDACGTLGEGLLIYHRHHHTIAWAVSVSDNGWTCNYVLQEFSE